MIIVITGPTGVGKTKLSEKLAVKYNAIIINADAVQVYKKLDIGSAKVTKDEMEDVEHFLFDIKDITEDYSVKEYQEDVRALLNKHKEKNVILVGGTGLYISSALYNYEFNNDENNFDYSEYSLDEIYKLALEKDKNIDIHKNNRVRLIRFLNKKSFSKNGDKLLYDAKFIGLTTNRENLYNIINKRVDFMTDNGLIEEVESLYSFKNKSRVLNTAIGYKEVIAYLDKQITKSEMMDLIKRNSRRYAKRQYTWFNNKMDINWFNVNYDNFDETIKEVEEYLEK